MDANNDVRVAIREANIRFWEVADQLGINDGNFSRMLRRELPGEKRQQIFSIVEDLARGKQKEAD